MDAGRVLIGGITLAALAAILAREVNAAPAPPGFLYAENEWGEPVYFNPETGDSFPAEPHQYTYSDTYQNHPEAVDYDPYPTPYSLDSETVTINPEHPFNDAQDVAIDLDAERLEEAPGPIASALQAAFQPSHDFDPSRNGNVRAFLDMIAFAEGANYNTLYGGGTFMDFVDHPRTIIRAGGYASSAAGRYQFLRKTWDDVAPRIKATDFSPYWQDRAAIYLIKRRGALADVLAGRFDSAMSKVRKEWASLPGAGYGQPERPLSRLRDVYLAAGGEIATV